MTTKPTVLEKQPWEERDFDFDLASKIPDGRTLASLVSITAVAVGTVGATPVTISNETFSGTVFQARYAGGTHGDKWLITFRGLDSAGQKVEGEGYLVVKEVP